MRLDLNVIFREGSLITAAAGSSAAVYGELTGP